MDAATIEAHREFEREYYREYRIKNREKIRKVNREWKLKHPTYSTTWSHTPWECPQCGELKTKGTKNYHIKNKCPGRPKPPTEEQEVIEDDFLQPTEEEPQPPPPTEEELREILMLYTPPPPPPPKFCSRPRPFDEFQEWWNDQ
jgi:hypothetical protein